MTNNHGIKKLNDYSHIRLKTNMYYGSSNLHTQDVVIYRDLIPVIEEISWVPALFTAAREIFDNSLDEIIGHGHGSRIDITYKEATCEFTVEDDGRGIPIDWSEEHQCHLATMVLSEARAGRNFEERGETVGTNGIGAAGVNFCSDYFKLDIYRDGKHFHQEFNSRGDNHIIGKPKIKEGKAGRTGTKIAFKLSKEVFRDQTLPDDFVRSRVTEIAISNPTIKVYYNGKQIKLKPKIEQSLFPDRKPIFFNVDEEGVRSRFWITYGNGQNENSHTVVNNIFAINGGVHMESFRRFFYANLLTGLERESKRRKLTPNKSDVSDGLFIYNITQMIAPNFDSQSKTRLINENVNAILRKHLNNPDFYKDLIRKNPAWIDAIYKRCEARTNKKDAAELDALAKKTKRLKIEELEDATSNNRRECILYLCEGKSAVSGAVEARDPKIHGALPLRGKVMNVLGEPLTKVANNEALKKIMSAVGLMVGQKANRSSLRYGKIAIAADSDPDGDNICALLVNFFYQLWPELFTDKDDPFIVIFQTPFIIATKGKQKKYWYSDNHQEFVPDNFKGWEITRAKGLASLKKDDWKNALAEPRVIPIVDEGDLAASLQLLFGPDADKRKEWLSDTYE